MNINIVTLLFIVVIVSVNGLLFEKELTLEQISGTWEGLIPLPLINLFPEPGFPGPVQVVCRDEIPEACERTIPDASETFIIDSVANTFKTNLILKSLATDEESSAKIYPKCAEEGIFLAPGEFRTGEPIISYEDGKLTTEYGETMTSCIGINVYTTLHGEVKAKIRQVLDIDAQFGTIRSRLPYVCPADKDSMFDELKFAEKHMKDDEWPFSAVNSLQNGNFYKDNKHPKEEEDECIFEFSETGIVGKYDVTYVLTCVEGPCLDLAKRKESFYG